MFCTLTVTLIMQPHHPCEEHSTPQNYEDGVVISRYSHNFNNL